MMYMTDGIQMETVFGDGAAVQKQRDHGRAHGRGQAAAHGGKPVHDRLHQRRRGQAAVAFAAPYAGRILALDLAGLGGT